MVLGIRETVRQRSADEYRRTIRTVQVQISDEIAYSKFLEAREVDKNTTLAKIVKIAAIFYGGCLYLAPVPIFVASLTTLHISVGLYLETKKNRQDREKIESYMQSFLENNATAPKVQAFMVASKIACKS